MVSVRLFVPKMLLGELLVMELVTLRVIVHLEKYAILMGNVREIVQNLLLVVLQETAQAILKEIANPMSTATQMENARKNARQDLRTERLLMVTVDHKGIVQ